MVRRFFVLGLLVLAACAPRGFITLMPEAAKVGQVRTVFIGTTRGIDAAGGFDTSRAEAL